MPDRWRALRVRLVLAALLCLSSAARGVAAGNPEELLYTIQPGDTLIGIAATQLTEPARWQALKSLNRVADERRLRPGSTLRIPVDWVRHSPAQAIVVRSDGDATVDGRVPRAGEILVQGARIATGEQGSVTLRFADGATATVQPRTTLRLEQLQSLTIGGANRTRMLVERGRVENAVTPQRKPGALFEVRTPAAVAGVRGTRYRVADLEGTALAEVLEGAVNVAGSAGGASGIELQSGFGVRVAAGGSPGAPVPLLAAPDLTGQPALQERTVVRFRIPALAGAVRYRARLAPDASFEILRRDILSDGPEIRFVDLPDGEYVLGVRGIDASGLEGRDGVHAFRLKARPEPPFAAAPADRGKIRGQQVALRWTAAAEADRYVVQVAADAGFRELVIQAPDIRATTYTPKHEFKPGRYAWRIASVRADGDRGPWSDAASFDVLPAPAAPEPPTLDDRNLVLRWPAEPGQRFLFQMAIDQGFAQPVVARRLEQPTITLPRPEPGIYYVRVQATDPDGFVGPFTATQRIEVPKPPPSPWLLLFLLPLLIAF